MMIGIPYLLLLSLPPTKLKKGKHSGCWDKKEETLGTHCAELEGLRAGMQ